MTNVSVSPAFNQNAVGLNPPAGFTAGISMGGTGGEDRFIDTNSTLLTVGHANGVISVRRPVSRHIFRADNSRTAAATPAT